ncbi:MAG TPA: hypothetical protein VHE83_15910 [Mycobacteriales bacterium]|nr:hypothetical protein [Mycobacteriales bacterium]
MRAALVTGGSIALVGIIAIALGKRIVARTETVSDQLPALVSGGLGGLALVIIGCVVTYVQVGRVLAQRERESQAGVIDDALALADMKRARLEAEAAAAAEPARTARRTTRTGSARPRATKPRRAA